MIDSTKVKRRSENRPRVASIKGSTFLLSFAHDSVTIVPGRLVSLESVSTTLRQARELGAPRVGRVALDSSTIKANASKHTAMSCDRMRAKQQQRREEVSQLLA